MAPATESQGSFLSRISIRRNQIVSMDINHEHELEELEDFQKHVADCFSELLHPSSPMPSSSSFSSDTAGSQPSDPILSIPWLQNLLNVFMSCEAEFKAVLTTTQISKSPSLERVLPEMLDRILKALDICNAVVTGIESVRQNRRLAEIAVTALKQRPLCEGSVRRAKRALASLLIGLNADRNNSGISCFNRRTASRSWSFGQRSSGATGGGGGSSGHAGKNWSATRQIQGMAANLVPPRGAEASGPAMPVYIMSSIMALVMWVLVAAVPSPTSGVLVAQLSLPKHQSWASAAMNLQERIGEEMKRKERRLGGGGGGFSGGLMEEMQRMERIGLSLMGFTERFRFPAEEEEEVEVAEKVDEMEEICRKMETGLDDLQRQVREVFHKLVRSRINIVSLLDQAGRSTATAI